MTLRRHPDGEYIELILDGEPGEHFVSGRVTADEFRAELQRWFATEREGEPSVRMPTDPEVDL